MHSEPVFLGPINMCSVPVDAVAMAKTWTWLTSWQRRTLGFSVIFEDAKAFGKPLKFEDLVKWLPKLCKQHLKTIPLWAESPSWSHHLVPQQSFGEQTSDFSLPLQGFNITFRGVKWWVKRLNLHLFSWCCIIQGHKSFANPVVAEKFEMMEDDRTFWKWRLLQRKMILRKNRLVDRCVI